MEALDDWRRKGRVKPELWQAIQQRGNRLADLQPGEVHADAYMRAAAKAEVPHIAGPM